MKALPLLIMVSCCQKQIVICLPTKHLRVQWTHLNVSVCSRSNWNLEVLVFRRSTRIWLQRQDLNLGHIGGKRVLSPLPHPFSPSISLFYDFPSLLTYVSLTGCLQGWRGSVTSFTTIGWRHSRSSFESGKCVTFRSEAGWGTLCF